MGATKETVTSTLENYFPDGVCCGVAAGRLVGGTGCGELVGAPRWITLSVEADFPGRKKIFIIKHNTTNNAERYIVA